MTDCYTTDWDTIGKGNPLRVPRCIPSGAWRGSSSSLSSAMRQGAFLLPDTP